VEGEAVNWWAESGNLRLDDEGQLYRDEGERKRHLGSIADGWFACDCDPDEHGDFHSLACEWRDGAGDDRADLAHSYFSNLGV
jgi:hypothetical protein